MSNPKPKINPRPEARISYALTMIKEGGDWCPYLLKLEDDKVISRELVNEKHYEKQVAQDRLEVKLQEMFHQWI